MNFESILEKSIDEKVLAENVFAPILKSNSNKLPFVSTESRIVIERYLINLLCKDFEEIKREFELLTATLDDIDKQLKEKTPQNMFIHHENCGSSISRIKELLETKISAPDLGSEIIKYKEYTLGADTLKVTNKVKCLREQIKDIDASYAYTSGLIRRIDTSEGSEMKERLLEIIREVKTKLAQFLVKLNEPVIEEETKDVIKDIWTNLLIDAVSILKLNDTREKIYQERTEEVDSKSIFEIFNLTRRSSSYGVEEIAKYFDDFVAYEAVLYGMNKYYRDHKKHVLQVWALGVSLIHQMHENGANIFLNDKYETEDIEFQFTKPLRAETEKLSEESRLVTKSELWAMWTIIALCHDLGYPIEKTSQINKQAKKIISHFGSMQFTELDYNFSLLNTYLIQKFLNIISSRVDIEGDRHKTSVQEKYKDKLSKSLEDYKHGIFSSLLLFKNLTYFQETDYSSGSSGKTLDSEDARQFYIRKEILRSIAGHTCPKLYHIRLDTLAFLLILCDELQEWNRPRADNLLNLTKEEPPIVKVDEFKLGTKDDSISISMSYDMQWTEDFEKHVVISRFKHIHYLLRSGKDDGQRVFKFSWEIKFKNATYQLIYNSTLYSYELLKVERALEGESMKEFSLYD